MAPTTDTTALVTGAGRGIGRAIARRLAADGMCVAVHYGSSRAAAQDVVAEIIDHGGAAFAVQAPLDADDGPARLWRAFDEQASGLDVLVNNAGVLGPRGPYEEVDAAGYDEVFAVNTRAPFLVTQQGLRRLRDGGRIVNVSTSFTHGLRTADLLPYTMSKAAIDAFTSTLATTLGARGITVNAVGPGATATEMNAPLLSDAQARAAVAARSPLQRVAEPGDIADIVAFLASDDARWVTGQWIDASGGALL